MASRARELHDQSLVIDGLRPRKITAEKIDQVAKGGIDAVQQTVVAPGGTFTEAIQAVRETQQTIENTSNVEQARSVAEIERQDEVSVIFGFQDTTPLELDKEPDNARIFDQLGVRVIQLTYNDRNYAGNGCTERVDDGISDFGLALIESMEDFGIVLDLSHVGEQTALDAIDASADPVIFSHSNANAVHQHPRNISDDLIKGAAETGGTIGFAVFPPMVDDDPLHIDDFIAHLDYVAELVGPEHVALGMDFVMEDYPEMLLENPEFPNPPFNLPDGIASEPELPNLTEELLDRGYSESEVQGILGGNLRRVFEAVWH